jgi:hypothetical protein
MQAEGNLMSHCCCQKVVRQRRVVTVIDLLLSYPSWAKMLTKEKSLTKFNFLASLFESHKTIPRHSLVIGIREL